MLRRNSDLLNNITMGKINKGEIQTKAVNTICDGTTLSGDVETKSDIRLDGVLKGKLVTSGKVVIGQTGLVEGDIFCDTIDVLGRIEGNVEAKDLVSLKGSAKVNGNIATKHLTIEPGVVFNGFSKMHDEKAVKQK